MTEEQVKERLEGDNKFVLKGDTLEVPMPDVHWSDAEYSRWWYSLYQLAGSYARETRDFYTDDKLPVHKTKDGSFYNSYMRKLNEYRCEKNRYNELLGKRLTLEEGRDAFNRGISESKILKQLCEQGKEGQAMAALHAYDNHLRKEWQVLDEKAASNREELDPKGQEYFDKLIKNDYETHMNLDNPIMNSQELHDLGDKMLREVFDIDPEEQKEKDKDDGNSGSGETGEEEGEFEKVLNSTLSSDDLSIKLNDQRVDIEAEWEGPDKPYVPYGPQEVHLITWSKLHNKITSYNLLGEMVSNPINEGWGRDELRSLTADTSDALSRRLLKFLEVNSYSTKKHNQKKGKLSSKSIYRLAVPNQPTERLSRVFHRKMRNSNLDTSLSFLIDCSGSMSGDKYEIASRTVLLMNGLLRTLDIDYELAGFTDGDGNIHYLCKPFEERMLSQERLLERLRTMGSYMSGNSDADSVLLAYNRLLQRKCPRKVLVVVSDGQPAGGRGNPRAGLKMVTSRIEADRKVELYAVGIKSRSVQEYYKNYEVIDQLSGFEGAMLSLIKQSLT
jgi:cobalamin biosynthesis protein CobT